MSFENRTWRKFRSNQFRSAAIFAILFFSFLNASEAQSGYFNIVLESEPEMPQAVHDEFYSLLTETIDEILLPDDIELLKDPDSANDVSEAIRTGLNIVTEPRGYTVYEMNIAAGDSGADVIFKVHPYGWTPEVSCAVESVKLILSTEGISQFWHSRYSERLKANESAIMQILQSKFAGLPVNASIPDWSINLTLSEGIPDEILSLFPSCHLDWDIKLSETAQVTLIISGEGDLIELVRPRMYSRTLFNVVLDRFRERLSAEASQLLVGVPRDEIIKDEEIIEARLCEILDSDPLSDTLDTWADVSIRLLDDQPVVVVDATIESRSYDTRLETFIDFGNENNDSSEVQARFGYLLGRSVEIFTNLNFFTNDSELETDVGIGLRPTPLTFVGYGYDLRNEENKYFFEQAVSTGFNLRGEIFEESERNEFGLTYQFQQYLSGGFYTNGKKDFWFRAIFTL